MLDCRFEAHVKLHEKKNVATRVWHYDFLFHVEEDLRTLQADGKEKKDDS